ncbi:AAA family ATPase [Methylomicrobium agile]|uniref:AAA family ATPase n=1 Tax=Methylomicrobium agile TaxID=39774 RepID=UPI0004DF4B30|nr:lipoprotein [Methylomicrobium agile]
MSTARKHSFIAVTGNQEHIRWLKGVFKDTGEVVVADLPSLERVRQILDLTGAQLVFVALTPQTLRQDTALIEGLVAVKPLLSVIAMADQIDNEMLLLAMRAGARDFVTAGSRHNEVINLVQRMQNRAPAPNTAPASVGQILTLVSARPGSDAPMLALHLALAMQGDRKERNTLLLDLGNPVGDTLMYLGLNSPYSFIDAVRSLRRLDSMLIDSAFAKHESGLSLLSLPEEQGAMSEITSADIYVLLGMLRRYFSRIVINLGGVPQSDFLYLLLNNSDNALVVVEQTVPSCKQNMQFVRKMIEHNIAMKNVGLVIDRYLPQFPPNAESLSHGFGLELLATLPPSGMARLNMMNSGESLFQCAPRAPYTLAVRKLAKRIMDGEASGEQDSGTSKSLLETIGSWFGGKKGLM